MTADKNKPPSSDIEQDNCSAHQMSLESRSLNSFFQRGRERWKFVGNMSRRMKDSGLAIWEFCTCRDKLDAEAFEMHSQGEEFFGFVFL